MDSVLKIISWFFNRPMRLSVWYIFHSLLCIFNSLFNFFYSSLSDCFAQEFVRPWKSYDESTLERLRCKVSFPSVSKDSLKFKRKISAIFEPFQVDMRRYFRITDSQILNKFVKFLIWHFWNKRSSASLVLLTMLVLH